MRFAGRVGGVGIAAALVLLGATAALWWGRFGEIERMPASLDLDKMRSWDLSLPQPPPPPPPPPPIVGFRGRARGPGVPVPRAVSVVLPPWFGDAHARPVRIAGRVIGARPGMSVRLAIDVPDPGIWIGRETAIAADGTFDFGSMRPGAYLLVAWGAGWTSRLTQLDTRREPGERAELFVHACRPIAFSVRRVPSDPEDPRPLRPAADVALERAGRVVGRTDATGHATVCARDRAEVVLYTPGEQRQRPAWNAREDEEMLSPAYTWEGVVVGPDGTPARGVGVQPIWRAPGACQYGECVAADTVVTTDADGRFRFESMPMLRRLRVLRGAVDEYARCPFADLTPGITETAVVASLPVLGGERLVIRLGGEQRARAAPGWWLRGHVVDAEGPAGDARIELSPDMTRDAQVAYARSDGSFKLWISDPDQTPLQLEGADPDRRLAGRTWVAAPRPLDEVTLVLGPGASVAGTVVDERGRPVAGVSVSADDHGDQGDQGDQPAPVTGADGAYQLALGMQGRYRLHVFDAQGRELAPRDGKLPPAVDVASPSGTRRDVRIVVKRGSAADEYAYESGAEYGAIDLGAQLEEGVVIRVGDEAAAAGTRLGDRVLSIEDKSCGDDGLCWTSDFQVGFGRALTWQVRRGGKVLTLHARAPTLGAGAAPRD